MKPYTESFFMIESLYSVNYLIQINFFQFFLEFLHIPFWKRLLKFLLINIYDLADRGASDPAPSLDAQQHLLVAEQGARFDLPQPVLQATHGLHDLPGLVADRVLVVVFDLDDRLDDQAATLQDVEYFRFLSNVEHYVIWLILHLIELFVEFRQIDVAPLTKKGEAL